MLRCKTNEGMEALNIAESEYAHALTLIRQHIRENQLLIQLLQEKSPNEETIQQIKDIYRESVELAKQYKVSLYVLYDFADFLLSLNDYDEAIELCHWLLHWYELNHESKENLQMIKSALHRIKHMKEDN